MPHQLHYRITECQIQLKSVFYWNKVANSRAGLVAANNLPTHFGTHKSSISIDDIHIGLKCITLINIRCT